ncbi:YetF domain-containing protein [Alkaliphilus peptidifermentans]|uniref:Uncharacterized membrane protein YcaP, DUF421 family n=1 Tax=Alkaliphilus peptidifermentans DSM 18978 TaxID=1120976 RepID=A0A1G5J368_9FIRM|nr:DUF421 domain-containing protein [Alkaliphilus peptidifermentans]SCY82400.1 Uncharacterized membrane protein YcaP, DUF421 family [Alkaliphilus peptidifermentans DSM 18978]
MLIIFTRAFILYFIVVIVMRMMGKRQIAQMQPFELVITIMIAELAATPMENASIPLINGVIPILTLLSVQVLVSFLSLKSEIFREVICGKPSVLIYKGKIVQSEIRRLRINMNDLLEQLRGKDYPNLHDVEYAILETNGQISVIPRSEKQQVLREDMKIYTPQEELPVTLIVDGNLIRKNLKKAGLDEDYVIKQLKMMKIDKVEETFFAFLSSDQKFYAQKKTLQ